MVRRASIATAGAVAPRSGSRKSPPGVLRLVILEVFPTLDRAPPAFVGAVPVDGGSDRLLEAVFGLPAQLAANFVGVDGVSTFVAGAVLHVLHVLSPPPAHLAEDGLGDPAVGDFVVPADVVDLSEFSVVQHGPERLAVV